ncbi:hypothetical protein GH733_009675, partial [Mirounga leonina]
KNVENLTEEKYYEHKKCGTIFNCPSSFRLTISTGDRPYNCKQCDKSFHFSYFTVHVIMHTGRETLWIYEMQLVKIHIGEKAYKCKKCGKMYFLTLQCLFDNIHTEEEPYKFKECGKAFTSFSIFCQVVRTHTVI